MKNDDLSSWIERNFERGVARDEMVQALFDAGYGYDAIAATTKSVLDSLERAGLRQLAQARPPRDAFTVGNATTAVHVCDDVLTAGECERLTSLIRTDLIPSRLSGNGHPHGYRTSMTCHLGLLGSDVVHAVDEKICKLVDIPHLFGEPLQGHIYAPGQEFKPHHDYFDDDDAEECGGLQRTYTVLIYLNDVRGGGGTDFDQLDLKISAKQGRALVWNNLDVNGDVNPATRHSGLPVTDGEKIILTKWFREPRIAALHHLFPQKPRLSERGFAFSAASPALLHALRETLEGQRPRSAEQLSSPYLQNAGEHSHASNLLGIELELQERVCVESQAALETWLGVKLYNGIVYGIREYLPGALVRMHYDRESSHHVGAIIHVARTGEDWPLCIEDHGRNFHSLRLEPGAMLLYESATLLHGRPSPFGGASYANVFCHFSLDARTEA